MKIRIFAIVISIVMVLSLFVGCGKKSKYLNGNEAQNVALADAGLDASEVTDLHAHIGRIEGEPVYNVHFTYNDQDYSYLVSAATGEILAEE